MAQELKIKSVIGFNGKYFPRCFNSISFLCVLLWLFIILLSPGKCLLIVVNIGKIRRGLSYTPCGRYVVYPLGSFVVLKNVVTDKEAFLDGHTSEVSCISISSDGERLASGQIHLMGVKVRFDPFLVDIDFASSWTCVHFSRLVSALLKCFYICVHFSRLVSALLK